ncbi:MAG: hypothetical protein COA93_04445 [Alphaproteobacteria bacterium]|nr:MAG: hypothetical protein COA93_04445 [Alphaproteobacteria bacterium]
MQFRNIIQKFITLGTGIILIFVSIFVVIVIREYYWENESKRMNQEFAETTKKVAQSIASNNRLDERIRQVFRERERKTRLYHMSLSTDFKEGRCLDYLKLLDFKTPLMTPESLLQADLYMRGTCAKQDFSKAFALYDTSLHYIYDDSPKTNAQPKILFEEYYGYTAHIKFRLASLYWRGQGVSQDKKKARELSKEAAVILAPWYAKIKHRPSDSDLGPTNAWNMSDVDILENVTFHGTGPWDMPEPLIQQINWLKEIHKQGAKTYLEIGLHLLNGTGGYEQNPVMAYEWIYIASHFYDYGPAHYPRAMLMRNEEFHEKRKKFPIVSIDFSRPYNNFYVKMRSYNLLRSAAKSGDTRADKELLRFHQHTPTYMAQQQDIYFWMLRLYQQNDPDITEEALRNFRKKLDKFQINYTEEAVKENRFPSYPIRPPKEQE